MTHDALRSVNSSIGTVRGRPDSEGKKKDLYGNRDNKLKKILHPKVLNKKAVLYCRGDFLAFCVVKGSRNFGYARMEELRRVV